jgi:hypothetical protein
LSLDGIEPSLSISVNAVTNQDMAISGTVADNITDFIYSLVGNSLAGLTFNTDGTRSFEPSILFDSPDTPDSEIVALCRCVTHPNR